MLDRTVHLISSLAVAVLALTLTAAVWRTRGLDLRHTPTLAPSSPSGCTPPALRSFAERECIA
jgi:hypothetical protein